MPSVRLAVFPFVRFENALHILLDVVISNRSAGSHTLSDSLAQFCIWRIRGLAIPKPRTFVLETDDEGRVTEAFSPDFYLPEQDLFLEVTVMKQSLVTRKNRKLRKLREQYPDVNVKLFYKRDIERLAQRYRLDLAS